MSDQNKGIIKSDLEKSGFAWVYGDNCRILVVYNSKGEAKELRKQGVTAIDKLRDLEITEVVVFM